MLTKVKEQAEKDQTNRRKTPRKIFTFTSIFVWCKWVLNVELEGRCSLTRNYTYYKIISHLSRSDCESDFLLKVSGLIDIVSHHWHFSLHEIGFAFGFRTCEQYLSHCRFIVNRSVVPLSLAMHTCTITWIRYCNRFFLFCYVKQNYVTRSLCVRCWFITTNFRCVEERVTNVRYTGLDTLSARLNAEYKYNYGPSNNLTWPSSLRRSMRHSIANLNVVHTLRFHVRQCKS